MAQKYWGQKTSQLPGPVLVATGFPITALELSHEVASDFLREIEVHS